MSGDQVVYTLSIKLGVNDILVSMDVDVGLEKYHVIMLRPVLPAEKTKLIAKCGVKIICSSGQLFTMFHPNR